jgi:hypothetical protein
LPGKKALLEDSEIEAILVDVTESPVERPKKQRQWYSGKKKRHTIKTQLIANKVSREIIRLPAQPKRLYQNYTAHKSS